MRACNRGNFRPTSRDGFVLTMTVPQLAMDESAV